MPTKVGAVWANAETGSASASTPRAMHWASLDISTSLDISIGHDQVYQRAQGYAGGAFGEPGLGVVVPRGAGDVQMDPGGIAGEFLDEHGAGDGAAALAAADILDVGYGAFDEFAVVVINGHLPHFFAGGFGAGQEFVGEGLVGAEDADVDIGQGDHDGARKSSGVNEMGGTKLLGVVDAVGEDEAALGVGVQNFDRFAGHGGLDIAGLLGASAGHVFCARNDANNFDVWL